MSFIRVVPVLRTPYGMDVFDYAVEDAEMHIGDLIIVPFRLSEVPALVVGVMDESPVASRARWLRNPGRIMRFGPGLVGMLNATAVQTFTARTAVLHAWLRKIPKKKGIIGSIRITDNISKRGSYSALLTENRPGTILKAAREEKGRVLILTPWKQRAESLSRVLKAPCLHADLSDGACWKAWTDFIFADSGILVSTRIGAWLSVFSDAVILDEPENDDHKQDEMAPRFDARWLTVEAQTFNPQLSLYEIGTTPRLSKKIEESAEIPELSPKLTLEPWSKNSGSPISGLSAQIMNRIDEAVGMNRPVIVLHPIKGDRGRLVCRDCGWKAECAGCGFDLSLDGENAICRRCRKKQSAVTTCPSCGGADFSKSRAGKKKVAEQLALRYGRESVQAYDLAEWHRLSLRPCSLVVVTDFSLIGGYAEDIRRRERLIIAWRRLAAVVQNAQAELVVQGSEDLLTQARDWLTPEGLKRCWEEEFKERKMFGFPPAKRRIKCVFNGSEEKAKEFEARLVAKLGDVWKCEGPFPVAFRPKSRQPRFVIHLLPDKTLSDEQIKSSLIPYAKEAIIDLDPIAFYS